MFLGNDDGMAERKTIMGWELEDDNCKRKKKDLEKAFGEAIHISGVDAYLVVEMREEFLSKYGDHEKLSTLYSVPWNKKVVFSDSLIRKMVEENRDADIYLFPILHELSHIKNMDTARIVLGEKDYSEAGIEQRAMKQAYEWLSAAKGQTEALKVVDRGLGENDYSEYVEKWLPFLKDSLSPEGRLIIMNAGDE